MDDGEQQSHFKDWELKHLANRANQFGLTEEKEILYTAGWDTEYSTDKRSIHSILSRLSEIPQFQNSCSKPSCSICRRIEEEFQGPETLNEPWILDIETYRWQKEAAEKWFQENGRGIAKVVTGAGKTIFALSLIDRVKNSRAYKSGGLSIAIVVPTTALLDQWYGELHDMLNLPEDLIGRYYASEKEPLTEKPLTIYVLKSAANHLPEHAEELDRDNDLFLIVDECHRSGSPVYSNIYDTNPAFTLGLSATPERRVDYGFEEKIVPNLGPVIYNFGYQEAMDDGIIPPYHLKRISVSLTSSEQTEYERLSDKLKRYHQKLTSKYDELTETGQTSFFKTLGDLAKRYDDPLIEKYTSTANIRKGIIHTSQNKMKALSWIIENELTAETQTLIYHERIESAEKILKYMSEKGFDVGCYHSEMNWRERKLNLDKYRAGKIQILISCTALDEGLDVPDTSAGIIVAATSSVRQRIQRIGRILRRAPGKDHSLIYTIFVDDLETSIYDKPQMKELENAAEKVEIISI